MRSLLIANRGEIALRVIRTANAMGLRTVAVYSDADHDLPHVRAADMALHLGPPQPEVSYLDGARLIALAREHGVDAIHPGYGFLSENAAFAEACLTAGLVWVGPPPDAMRAMADKGAAKNLMAAAGVPVLPGLQAADGREPTDAELRDAAQAAGYPVLLKAVAGGGGRGIRLVEDAGAFDAALEGARREAGHHFGDGRVLVEKYLEAPRHVEVQVLCDSHGGALHLYERECSVQRRHQKLVEETPSPALNDALREAMTGAAIRAAQAIGYQGAGTVEFLLDASGGFYFLEMNTRLQVEHPITEELLGVDLVRAQLEVAAGAPLPWRQEDLRPNGHAIECRLIAEDPARAFMPSTGTLLDFAFPTVPGGRVDAGFAAGNEISPHYDSLLAKLIAHGPNRAEALRRMEKMLEGARVTGIVTNLNLLHDVLRHPAFASGDYSTRLLEDHTDLGQEALEGGDMAHLLLAAAAADALHLCPPLGGAADDAASMHAPITARRLRHYQLGEMRETVEVLFPPARGLARRVEIIHAGTRHAAELEAEAAGGPLWLRVGEARWPLFCRTTGGEGQGGAVEHWLRLRGRNLRIQALDPVTLAARSAGGDGDAALRAPLPGKVIKLHVAPGEAVAPRQLLLTLEAMKVEHAIAAPFAGIVRGLPFAEGTQVRRDDLLVELEGEGQEAT